MISFTINFYQRWVFIIADGGTLTSSFSKDARQQETLKHSVDQDTQVCIFELFNIPFETKSSEIILLITPLLLVII